MNTQTETKHTPGPWQLVYVFDEDQYRLKGISIESAEGEVAFIFAEPDEDGCIDDMSISKRDRKNAALIASAPDMAKEIAQLKADKAELVAALEFALTTPWMIRGRDKSRAIIAKHAQQS